MEKISKETCHPNDVPVIFIYNHQDEIIGKLSINEWKAQKKAAQLLNELEIKLYREAINYYTSNDFDKAEDILLFLILQTDYTHYEYVERLANLYRRNQRHSKEKELLLKAKKTCLHLRLQKELFDGLINVSLDMRQVIIPRHILIYCNRFTKRRTLQYGIKIPTRGFTG